METSRGRFDRTSRKNWTKSGFNLERTWGGIVVPGSSWLAIVLLGLFLVMSLRRESYEYRGRRTLQAPAVDVIFNSFVDTHSEIVYHLA